LIEVLLEYEKDTKNTVRLQEVEGDDAPAIGTLYLQKHAYKKLGSPQRVKLNLEAGQ